MAALASFLLETTIVSCSSVVPPRCCPCSSLSAKYQQTPGLSYLPAQKLLPHGLPSCNSGSISPGLSRFQTRARSSEDPIVDKYEAVDNDMNRADNLDLSEEARGLASEANSNSTENSETRSTSSLSGSGKSQPVASSSKDDLPLFPSRRVESASEALYQTSRRIENAFSNALAYKNLKVSKISGDTVAKGSSKESSASSNTQEIGAVRDTSEDASSSMSEGQAPSSSVDLYTFTEPESLSFSAVEYPQTSGFTDDSQSSDSRISQYVQSNKPDEGSTAQDPSKTSQAAALAAFRRAKAYKQQTEEMKSSLREDEIEQKASGRQDDKTIEVEIITRDGVIKRRVAKPGKTYVNVKEFQKAGMDFVGLDFAEKKTKYRTPAGLSAELIAPPSKALPEVEIITRDGGELTTQKEESQEELYKPKVATWGVFPRPANISKTYGGGRVIQPGEQLETEEEKKAREAKTQQLLADYRRKQGLDVDPVIKAKCEEMLKQGTSLMDKGKLREALGCFEAIMQQVTFKSELHGLAALQGAVCLDSLNRSKEARSMYEKLVSHPNQAVQKGARQFLFSFQAMENLKFSGTYDWDPKAYSQFFDAFSVGYNSYNTLYKAPKSDFTEEPDLGQTWPYAIFLCFPLLLILTLVLIKGS